MEKTFCKVVEDVHKGLYAKYWASKSHGCWDLLKIIWHEKWWLGILIVASNAEKKKVGIWRFSTFYFIYTNTVMY